MKIMTLNCGSSSVKYSLWNIMPKVKVKLCSGVVDRVTGKGGKLYHQLPYSQHTIASNERLNYRTALSLIVSALTSKDHGVIADLSDIGAVAHRVVHGAEEFRKSALVDDQVLESIAKCAKLAPLHNPANLLGIRNMKKLLPKVPHIAVFDTAFFTTMPTHCFIYAVPYQWYEKHQVRRYGFHGSSHLYVSRRAAAILGKKPGNTNLITLHIGNGVSVAAVKEGMAFDTSLGFTPLEGLVMGTRPGDLDPGVILYMMEKENLSVAEMATILNKNSGILGITGKYSDRRDVLTQADKGNARAKLALDIECYRLKKYIGAYTAAIGAVHALVFTAGVGENSPTYRARVCDGLDNILGISIDLDKNSKAIGSERETDISASSSKIKVLVIPTNEELVFVEDALAILQGTYKEYTDFTYSFESADFVPY